MSNFIDNSIFTHVDIHVLNTKSDYTGEYSTRCDIEFVLKKQPSFSIFGHMFNVRGVKMVNVEWSSDEFELLYLVTESEGDDGNLLRGVEVDEDLQKEIYRIICAEEEKENCGWLNRHMFSDCEMFEQFS